MCRRSGRYGSEPATAVTQYTLVAALQSCNVTGQRNFFTDQSGVIRQSTSSTQANVDSTPIGN
jgi:hypothetical protein